MGCVVGSFLLRLFVVFREGGVSERRVTLADELEARLLDGWGFRWLPEGGAVSGGLGFFWAMSWFLGFYW